MTIKTFLVTIAMMATAIPASAGTETPWTEGFNNKARLVAGRGTYAGQSAIFAGLEIVMPSGWKTYWRSPGDAGGVPPAFDWTGSENLKSAHILYPAPHRLTDKAGTSAGYKDRVVFLARVEPTDAAKPVNLKLKAAYGVCKELCIPAEAELTLAVPPDTASSTIVDDALKRVPGAPGRSDPALKAWRIEGGDKPRLVLDVAGESGGGDAFVDIADGTYLPMVKKVSGHGGDIRYEVDLTDGVDFAKLNGKVIAVTLTNAQGQSETSITIGETKQ